MAEAGPTHRTRGRRHVLLHRQRRPSLPPPRRCHRRSSACRRPRRDLARRQPIRSRVATIATRRSASTFGIYVTAPTARAAGVAAMRATSRPALRGRDQLRAERVLHGQQHHCRIPDGRPASSNVPPAADAATRFPAAIRARTIGDALIAANVRGAAAAATTTRSPAGPTRTARSAIRFST